MEVSFLILLMFMVVFFVIMSVVGFVASRSKIYDSKRNFNAYVKGINDYLVNVVLEDGTEISVPVNPNLREKLSVGTMVRLEFSEGKELIRFSIFLD